MNVVLANRDYGPARDGWGAHMTDEGFQLQEGLRLAGWVLCGRGYDDMTDVRRILERYKPRRVFVQDKRDMDPRIGAFRSDLMFTGLDELAAARDVFKIAVVKDAGTITEYHREFCEQIGASAVVIYYHEESVISVSPWLRRYELIRTYHSVDAGYLDYQRFVEHRGARAVVSGASNPRVYPLRWRVIKQAGQVGCVIMPHRGYGNKGCATQQYLTELSQYKISVATASAYDFALRKIIEAVAVGATPVTNLSARDRLPEIDQALVRVPTDISLPDLKRIIRSAVEAWNSAERMRFAEAARKFYDYQAIGARLSDAIVRASERDIKLSAN